MGITRNCFRVRDGHGVEWVTMSEAAREVERSRRTIIRWTRTGLESQLVLGVRYIPVPALFERLRMILIAEPETRTRRER